MLSQRNTATANRFQDTPHAQHFSNMATLLGKIRRLLGKTKEPRYETSGERPLKHWKTLRDAHTNDTTKSGAVVWKPVDIDFWENHLTGKELKVLRLQGTEPPRSSVYDKFYPATGYFACRACGLALYAARAKFDSGTGWPSFGEHIDNNVATAADYSHGMQLTELKCRQCASHLGHVFLEKNSARVDRLQQFTERQCINGVSIYYVRGSLSKGTNAHATAIS